MSIWNGKDTLHDSVAVFDIGSASIGVGVAVHTPQGVRLLWSMRLSYAYQRDLDYVRFERSMLATLLEAGMRLTSEGVPAAIEHYAFDVAQLSPVCILSQPWFIGAVRQVSLFREQGVLVTESVIKDLEKTAQKEFNENAARSAWGDVMGKDATLVETQILHTELDGYRVKNYLGKKAQKVQLTAYGAHAPSTVLAEIEDVLKKTLPNHKVPFRTSTHVAYRALEVQGLTQGSLVLVELGGEITAVSLVSKGALAAVKVFPQGTNHVLREGFPQVASYAAARGKLALLSPRAESQEGKSIPKGMTTALEAWHTSLTESITELVEGVTPPRNAVLVCNEVWKPWFVPALRTPWRQPGVRADMGFSVVEQQGVFDDENATKPRFDGRIASMLRGILTS